jgi:hypothetical protein
MPTYFYQKSLINQGLPPCNSTSDLAFLTEIVNDFKKLLTFMPAGEFPATLIANIQFEAKAIVTENIVLTLQGTVQFLYSRIYGEAYPKHPTAKQIKQINNIWIGIGHPENIIYT